MKTGEEFNIGLDDLAKGLVGRLADVVLEGGEKHKVRILETSTYVAKVKVVHPHTKE